MTAEAQPCRALKRGLTLLITKTRPRRRTTRQFLSRFFSVFSELTIFMAGFLGEARNIGITHRQVNEAADLRIAVSSERAGLIDRTAPSRAEMASCHRVCCRGGR